MEGGSNQGAELRRTKVELDEQYYYYRYLAKSFYNNPVKPWYFAYYQALAEQVLEESKKRR